MSSSKQHIKLFPKQWHKEESIMVEEEEVKKIQATYFVKRETRRNCKKKRGGLNGSSVCISFLSYPRKICES